MWRLEQVLVHGLGQAQGLTGQGTGDIFKLPFSACYIYNYFNYLFLVFIYNFIIFTFFSLYFQSCYLFFFFAVFFIINYLSNTVSFLVSQYRVRSFSIFFISQFCTILTFFSCIFFFKYLYLFSAFVPRLTVDSHGTQANVRFFVSIYIHKF